MKHLLSALLLACAATASAQTIRTLGYNSSNGVVVANTGTNILRFPSALKVSDLTLDGFNIIGNIEFSFEDGSFRGGNLMMDSNSSIVFLGDSKTATRANLGFSTNLNTLWTATNASNARSAVELGLPALTNTSNVTMMRALSGSTNTNQPYSGTVSVVGTNNTNVLVFSNGVLQEVQ